ADAVQTSTEELGRRWRPWARCVAVFPNQLSDVPPLTTRPDRPLTVGWGGSSGHYADWYHVAPALEKWLAAHPDVHLAVMSSEQVKPFVRLSAERYHFTPAGSLADYFRFLGTLDVGLAPLLPTAYNRCRSDVKFVEYASCGVTPVLAAIRPYLAHAVDGETALLFRDGKQLRASLERLLADPGLRYAIAARAHD